MNKLELFHLAEQGTVDELNLLSLESGIYLLEIRTASHTSMLRNDQDKVLHLRSVEHARTFLEGLPQTPFFLVHASPYNEMCGLDDAQQQPLRIPVSLEAWR